MRALLLLYLLVSSWRRLGRPARHAVAGVPAAIFWALIGVLLLTGFSAVLFPLSFIPFAMAFFARRVDPRTAWLCLFAPAFVGVAWADTVDAGASWVLAFSGIGAMALAIAAAFEARVRRRRYARQYTGRP